MPKNPHPPQQGFAKPEHHHYYSTTTLPLYYHHILEAGKLRSIYSNETLLEGTAVQCDILKKEWLENTESKCTLTFRIK